MKFEIFQTAEEFSAHYEDSSVPSNVLVYVKEPEAVYFTTNNIDGITRTYSFGNVSTESEQLTETPEVKA